VPTTTNPYVALHSLGLIQRQAGVDPEIGELVTAYARLMIEAGEPLNFEPRVLVQDSPESEYYERLHEKNPKVDQRVIRFLAAYAGLMAGRGLPVLFNVDECCRALSVSNKKLLWICANQRRYYLRHEIPKRNGTSRVILAPRQPIRRMQNWIARNVLARVDIHPCAHGFIPDRSIATNAACHVNRRVVVCLDIEDFFPSITHRRVRKAFQKVGYPYQVAKLLANVCTVDGRLPQGGVTSPALSNLSCATLDRRLSGLAERMNFRYTRYADDLILSSNNPKLPKLIPFFREIAADEGYRLHESKTRIMRQGRRQTVTGVVTNSKPNLPRDQIRRLRAAVHRFETQGPESVEWPVKDQQPGRLLQALHGYLGYLHMINPQKAAELKRGLKAIRA
jgi:retron-type reverse transcriptase